MTSYLLNTSGRRLWRISSRSFRKKVFKWSWDKNWYKNIYFLHWSLW